MPSRDSYNLLYMFPDTYMSLHIEILIIIIIVIIVILRLICMANSYIGCYYLEIYNALLHIG